MTNRRDFFRTLALLSLAACSPGEKNPVPPGELLGMDFALGHRLRFGNFPAPSETRRTGIAIIGGGISGLSAAWRLSRAGFEDYQVLELEKEAGGNSRSGHSPLVDYPWAAHYLPLPPPEATWVRELLAEIGVLQQGKEDRRPVYDENFLCATPQERVFKDGTWHEGLLPTQGLEKAERQQQQSFHQRMEEFKHLRGRDGRLVFALPMQNSSLDGEWRELDRLSFKQWLLDHGFTAPSLHWLANYACRDDYGTSHDQTSAWAGLHYFACRSGEAANAAGEHVLTAPDGNGWLAKALIGRCGDRLRTGLVVWRLREQKHSIEIDAWLAVENRSIRIVADRALWAAPAFLLPRVWGEIPEALKQAARAGTYAPWITANLHLSDFPQPGHGTPLAWDNVLYNSPGLGYVAATHQLIRRRLPGTVLTYYRALSDQLPVAWRLQLLALSREAWAEAILAELSIPHPEIRRLVSRIDVFRSGHAMRRPVIGSVWSQERQLLAAFSTPRLALAHADLSGFSIFEEAQYRGIVAAERLLAAR